MTQYRTPVLIAGGGPCGLMLSIELGRRHVPSVLVDSKSGTALNPQANATQARTMEYFRRLGFADEIRALGLPADYPTDIAYFTRYTGWELARFELPSSSEASSIVRDLGGSWSAAELPHRVSQKFVEEVLRQKAELCEASSLNYGWRLVDFDEREDSVEATVQHVESGETRSVVADYLIGADGARSFVRRRLGIRYGGETGVVRDFFGGKMVALYFRSSQFYELMPHPRAWMYWTFNPQRRSWLAAVNGRDEFAFHTQLRPGEDEDVSPERARALFAQAMGLELDMEVIAVDTWIAGHALVAERFGEGRVYIGGDAAHLFTPAGGLGYNTAIEDAVNLGWKLAAAVKGVAGPELLPSYAAERRALAVRNTNYARQLAESIGNYAPDPRVEEAGEAGDQFRASAGEYLNGHARREFNIPGVTFGSRYDGSSLIVPDAASSPPDSANVYAPTASPGGRTPHMWLSDGTSVFDALGFEWSLLVVETQGRAAAAAFLAAAERLGIELKIVDLTSEAAREVYEAELVLVRPDQIVAWRGRASSVDGETLLAKVMGHASPARPAQPACRNSA